MNYAHETMKNIMRHMNSYKFFEDFFDYHYRCSANLYTSRESAIKILKEVWNRQDDDDRRQW